MANINNYINAAAASLNSANEIERALADNKIKFADMGAAQVTASAADAVEAIRSNAQVKNAKTNAAALEEGAEIAKSRDESIEQSRGTIRKAGLLAAGANSLALANYYSNKKDQPNDMLTYMNDQRSALNTRILENEANILKRQQELAAFGKVNNSSKSTTDQSQQNQTISPVATGEAPAGSADRGTVFNYLTGDKGLSRNQALGLMANIDRESSFRIAPPGGDGGNSFGMLQWNNTYGRSDLMKKMVPDYQTNWKGQLDHALSQNQLPEYNKATSDFLNTDFATPQAASDAFMRTWEIPADPVAGSKKHAGFLSGYNF
jgi:hypothetical protein